MPSWISEAVEEQCAEWPSPEEGATPVCLTPEVARELQSHLMTVRNATDRSELNRRLRMLVCNRSLGVFFVGERVGSLVVVQSLDADPGGHAKLISCSSSGAVVKYTLTGREAVVDGARILNALAISTPNGVSTRSQAAENGVQLGRPELEAAELARWREELRRSREAERSAIERATSAEASAARWKASKDRSDAALATARQFSRELEIQRDRAVSELSQRELQSKEDLDAVKAQQSQKQSALHATIKKLREELVHSQAQQHRAVSSRIKSETFAAERIQSAEVRAAATVDALKSEMRRAVDDARAGTIDRMATLSGLADVLCPENAIVNMNWIDSLPMSDAATNEKSRRRGDYARVTSELCCALVQFAAGGDEARVKQLVEDVPQQLSWRRLFDGELRAFGLRTTARQALRGRLQERDRTRIGSVRPSETTN